jgi:diacylglycerol kinase family enzyme
MLGVMPSPFGRLAVIANPRDGHGRVGAELATLQRALTDRDLDYRLTVTSDAAETMRAATGALDDGLRFVVVVGDDDTVQDAVNGMFRDGAPIVDEPVLGVVAATGSNDLVRSFGLPRDTEGGVQRLLGDTTYALDVMKITCRAADASHRQQREGMQVHDGEVIRYAHNMAQLGLAANVSLRRRAMPRWLGERAGSFLGFWDGYIRTDRRPVRISYDTKEWEGPAFQVLVSNAQFGSGGLRLSPRSWPGDGVLDALVFTGQKSDGYTMMPRILRHGDHVPDPGIKELRAKIRFRVEADRPLAIVADGALLGTTPAIVQVMPQQILFKM